MCAALHGLKTLPLAAMLCGASAAHALELKERNLLGRSICSETFVSFESATVKANKSGELDEFDGRPYGFPFAALTRDKDMLVLARGKSASDGAAIKCSFITRHDGPPEKYVSTSVFQPAEKNQKCNFVALEWDIRSKSLEKKTALQVLNGDFEVNKMTCIRAE